MHTSVIRFGGPFSPFVALLIVLLGLPGFAGAAEPKASPEFERLQQMDLEQLLACKVQVASLKPLTTRRSPGVVTLVTREQIVHSGARDLLEVLRLFFPGFQSMNVFQGMVNGGFRGIEGRTLVLLDGLEITDELSESFPLGNEIPVDAIERIEIMRGPGSVLYGGFASNAVVNIIPRKPSRTNFVSYRASRSRDSFTHNNLTLGLGRTFSGSELDLIGMIGRGNRSDRDNVDYFGDSMSMTGNQRLDPEHLYLKLKTDGGLKVQALAQNYLTSNINLWGKNHRQGAVGQSFTTRALRFSQKVEVGRGWEMIPHLFYKREAPWQISVHDVAPAERWDGHKWTERVTTGLVLQGGLGRHTDAKFGAEHSHFGVYLPDDVGPYEVPFANGGQSVQYSTRAWFGEILHEFRNLLLSIGGRSEESDKFGKAVVPRLSLSGAWGDLSVKVARSGSFRTPGGFVLNLNAPTAPRIRPERADTDEIEVGYRLSRNAFCSVNFFDIRFRDLIQFVFDINGPGYFGNFGKMGTKGMEFELVFNSRRVRTNLNYAYYRSTRNDVPALQVPGRADYHLGFPKHAANALVSVDLGEGWWVSPSVSWVGKRYGFDHGVVTLDATGNPQIEDILQSYGPTAIWNVNVHRECGGTGLSFDVGMHDLFASDFSFLTSTASRIAPLPGPSRAFSLRIELNRNF